MTGASLCPGCGDALGTNYDCCADCAAEIEEVSPAAEFADQFLEDAA